MTDVTPIPPWRKPKKNQPVGIGFDARDRARLEACVKALGVTYAEFIEWATMNAVEECEGYGRLIARMSGPNESEVAWVFGARIIDRR